MRLNTISKAYKLAWFKLTRCYLLSKVLSCVFWYKSLYRLTHSASELLGFTCMSSLTMNEKPRAVSKNFEFIFSEQVQVNPDNSQDMSALTFLLFKLNTLHKENVKLWISRSHGVMTVVCWIYTNDIKEVVSSQLSITWYKPANQNLYSVWKLNESKDWYISIWYI